MKQIITFRTVLLAALVGMTFFASSTNAQSILRQPAVESQKLDVQTSYRSRATVVDLPSLSASAMESLTRSSISTALVEQSSQLTTLAYRTIRVNIASSISDIENGGSRNFVTPLATVNPSLMSQHSMRVHINFESRPIGGVLTVCVELVPQFSGVGVSNRPLASKMMITAIDSLDAATVSALVLSLSNELNEQIQHGSLN